MPEPDSDVALLHEHLRGEHSDTRREGCRACGGLPPVSPAEPPAPRQNTAHAPTGRLCGCGCGSPVKRRFLPGHDAKLKSRLLREARSGHEAARQELREHGWEHFI